MSEKGFEPAPDDADTRSVRRITEVDEGGIRSGGEDHQGYDDRRDSPGEPGPCSSIDGRWNALCRMPILPDGDIGRGGDGAWDRVGRAACQAECVSGSAGKIDI